MQKVLQRTAAAKRHAVRRGTFRRKETAKREDRELRMQTYMRTSIQTQRIKEARKVRREDWELGPLAPKRDVGEFNETYGAIQGREIVLPGDKLKPLKHGKIRVGDRVVVVEGRGKGKIGVVSFISEKSAQVQNVNMVDFAVPEWQRKADRDPRPVRRTESPIPLASLRLVHAIYDPTAGEKRDVIVEDVQFIWDKESRRKLRYIKGMDEVIPWPEVQRPEPEDGEDDTLRILVEEKTFIPTLLRPPMPESVIDELRGKYSRFRDRHDETYILAKTEQDAKEKILAEDSMKMMRTPLQETIAQREALKERELEKGLTEDMLAKIGEVIATTRGLNLEKEDISS